MKKYILFILIILCVMSIFSACNSSQDTNKENLTTQEGNTGTKESVNTSETNAENNHGNQSSAEVNIENNSDKKVVLDEEQEPEIPLVTEEEKKSDVIAVKKLTPEAIVRVKIPKKDVIVKINQIENKNYPLVKLFVSVTDTEGNPLELENPNLFIIEENGIELAKNEIKDILQQKQAKDFDLIPLSAVLAIDKSGSMALNADETVKLPSEEQPLFFAKNAAVEFLDKIQSYDKVEFIAFDHNIESLGTNFEALEKIAALEASGHTALYGALFSSIKSLENKEGIKAAILLTDGKNDVVRVPQENKLSHMLLETGLEYAEKLSVPVFTIGFGKGIDIEVLEHIATETHATFFSTGDKTEIAKLYDKIRRIINNQYIISYKTQFLTSETEVKVDLYGPHDIRNYQNPEELVEKEKVFKEKIENLDKTIDEYDEKFKKVEEKEEFLNKKEEELDEREEKLDEKEQILEDKEKTLEETKIELEIKKEELEKKDEELQRLEEELALLDSQLDDKDKKLSDLQGQLSNRETTLNEKKNELETRENELSKLQNELDILKKSLDARETQLNELNKVLNKREEDLNKLKTKLDSKDEDLNKLEEDLLTKKEDLTQKESQLKALSEKLDALQEELKAERERLLKIKELLMALLEEVGEEIEEVNP